MIIEQLMPAKSPTMTEGTIVSWRVKKGDTVITQGGIIGRIFKLGDDEVTIDTGEGGKLRIVRSMVVEVKNSDGPAPANDVKEG